MYMLYDKYCNCCTLTHNKRKKKKNLSHNLQGKAWEQEWGGHAAWSPSSNRSASVAVLIHPRSAIGQALFPHI